MFKTLHAKQSLQLGIGFLIGILFGFFLQKGGVTNYNIIMAQLLLQDFTVIKIMLTAVMVGMVGVYFMKSIGLAELHPKPGALGSSGLGGLIFGVGFGILGYCPGTAAGATAQGNIDALVGGVIGIMLGAGVFAALYPKLATRVLQKGDFSDQTIPRALKVNPWAVIVVFIVIIVLLLRWFESAGL